MKRKTAAQKIIDAVSPLMKKVEHTPTPWSYQDCVLLKYDDSSGKLERRTMGRMLEPKDAAFIIQAVNMHDKLAGRMYWLARDWHDHKHGTEFGGFWECPKDYCMSNKFMLKDEAMPDRALNAERKAERAAILRAVNNHEALLNLLIEFRCNFNSAGEGLMSEFLKKVDQAIAKVEGK